jgi:hypothetical protein
MQLQNGFLTEFLTEVNFVLTQEDYENKLEDVLNPIRALFLEQGSLLAFSLARYCESNTRIAFFCEWYLQILEITRDSSSLFKANQEYLKKRIPTKLKGIPNLYEIVDTHISNIFIPKQIALLHSKTAEFISDLKEKYPYLNKYLSKQFLGKFMVGDVISVSKIYKENLTLAEFIEAQSYRNSFVQVGLPCILGLCYSFNQLDNPINPKGVKWVLLESLLKNISILHEINNSKDLQKFLYHSSLTDKEEFEWLKKDPSTQLKIAISDTESRKKTQKIKQKIYQKSKEELEAIILPEKHKQMLKDLIDWANGEG